MHIALNVNVQVQDGMLVLTDREGKGTGRTWRNNFRLGVVDTIGAKLRQARKQVIKDLRKEHKAKGTALVVINTALAKVEQRDAEVDAFLEEHFDFVPLRNAGHTRDRGAREQGQEAGREINVGKSSAAIGSGPKRLKGGK